MFLAQHAKGTRVTGKILSVDVKAATIELTDGVEGSIRASELSIDQVDDARKVIKEGEDLEALVVGVDRTRRVVNLSVRAMESEEEAAALEEYGGENESTRTTLGDLLKEQLDPKDTS